MLQPKPKLVPAKRVTQIADSLDREVERKTIGSFSALKNGDNDTFNYGMKSAKQDKEKAIRYRAAVQKAKNKN